MKVFLAPGLYRNIKRNIIDGISVDETDIKDDSLRKRIVESYKNNVVKLWALNESLSNRWIMVNEGDYILFYNKGEFIYSARVNFKYPFSIKPAQVRVSRYLVERILGRDVKGRICPYLIFLKDVKRIRLSLSKFNELTGYNLKAVMGFMRARRDMSKVIQYIIKEKPEEPKSEEKIDVRHSEIVDMLYALGELIGYVSYKEWHHDGYKFDVVWHKPPRIGPKYVFEVHLKGSLEATLLRLKHAYDLWESQLFLVSTEDQLEAAKNKFLGELHELKDKVTLLNIRDVIEFYKFKGKYEWLERKFGLRPR